MKRCIVIGGVKPDFPLDKYITPQDFVICADRGWLHAKNLGIKRNMVVGDFDSSPQPKDTCADVTVLPMIKDDTDTYYIARYIIEQGFTDVLMAGVMGGDRPEHTVGTYQTLLFLASHRINATAMTANSSVMVIKDGKITLPDMPNRFFSVFSMGDKAEGVNIKGAKYPLADRTITNDYPIGVSNEFIGESVDIQVGSGSLLLIITKKD